MKNIYCWVDLGQKLHVSFYSGSLFCRLSGWLESRERLVHSHRSYRCNCYSTVTVGSRHSLASVHWSWSGHWLTWYALYPLFSAFSSRRCPSSSNAFFRNMNRSMYCRFEKKTGKSQFLSLIKRAKKNSILHRHQKYWISFGDQTTGNLPVIDSAWSGSTHYVIAIILTRSYSDTRWFLDCKHANGLIKFAQDRIQKSKKNYFFSWCVGYRLYCSMIFCSSASFWRLRLFNCSLLTNKKR